MFQGSNTSLVCLGAGPEDSLSWEKVGSSLGANTTTVLRDRIIITTSSVSDRGLYVCNVETSCGAQARASSLLEVSLHNMYFCTVHYCTLLSMQIEPREPPTVELYPATVQTVTRGESLLFQCRYMSGGYSTVKYSTSTVQHSVPRNTHTGDILDQRRRTDAEQCQDTQRRRPQVSIKC